MHAYTEHMRTTIEIPAELRRRLSEEAAARNLKGYSPIIVDALKAYFQKTGENRGRDLSNLKGSLSMDDYKRELARVEESRKQWQI